MSIRLNFQSSLAFYIHIYPFLINPTCQEWTEYPRFLLWCLCILILCRISLHVVHLVSGDKRRSLHIYWKGNEHNNSMHSFSHFISLLALFTNTPTMRTFCKAWTKSMQPDFNFAILLFIATKCKGSVFWKDFLLHISCHKKIVKKKIVKNQNSLKM